jgi:hypothetical protein
MLFSPRGIILSRRDPLSCLPTFIMSPICLICDSLYLGFRVTLRSRLERLFAWNNS